MDPRRSFGDAGERFAERALLARGIRAVARNARTRYGEIDLVCRDRAGYVFVEVKTRRASAFVSPLEAVDRVKRERLARLAEAWLAARGERDAVWRMAIAAITVDADGARIEFVDIDS